MSILFIFTQIKQKKTYIQTHPPLGISYLISYLKSKGLSPLGIDLLIDTEETVYKTIADNKIEYACVSVCYRTIQTTIELSESIKLRYPNIKIIWGGPHVEFLLDHLNQTYLDYLIFGEGEEPLYQLLTNIKNPNFNPYSIPNIAFLFNNQILQTPRVKPTHTLDSLPFPDREWVDINKYLKTMGPKSCYIIGSRYCPHNCSFCINSCNNNPFRSRSVPNIIEEIRFIKKTYPQYTQFFLTDETLNQSKERLVELCTALEKENIEWTGNMRVDNYMDDKELIELIKSSGNKFIEIGIESGSQQILNMNNKNISLKTVDSFLKITTSLNMPVICNFMMPHFQDTPETLKKTMDLIMHLSANYFIVLVILRTVIMPTEKNKQIIKQYGIIATSDGTIVKTNNLPDYLINSFLSKAQEHTKKNTLKNAQKIFLSQGFDLMNSMEVFNSLDFKNDKSINDLLSAFL
ncbi:MAG: radical SAM protein [Candidatus Margulisbacteria bacterium]|nr:radical SAM protein [Candidatus Margulisiibacteriota bacterium]